MSSEPSSRLPVDSDNAVGNIRNVFLVSYFFVSASALLFYDYILTIEIERDLIWSSRWSSTKILYLIQRYMPLLDTAILFNTAIFLPDPDPQFCKIILTAGSWLHILGCLFSQLLLSLQIWAVGRLKISNLGKFLLIFLTLCYGSVAVLRLARFDRADHINFPGSLIPWDQALAGFHHLAQTQKNCMMLPGRHLSSLTHILHLGYEIVIFILTLALGIPAYKSRRLSPLFNVIYRNVFFAHIIILVMSALILISVMILPPGLEYLFMPFTRVLGTILTSHVILQIRRRGRPGGIVHFEDGVLVARSILDTSDMDYSIEFERTSSMEYL